MNLDRVPAVAIDRTDTFTRAEISVATGLSAPTVGSLTSELMQQGVLTDLGTGPPAADGVRRSWNSTALRVCRRHRSRADATRLAVADLRGEVVAHQVLRTPRTRAPKAILERLADQLQHLMRQAGMPPDRLLAVGAGAPGVVDCETGHLIALAPNLRGWSDVPMGTILAKALDAPVIVENDVNLAILGERWRGAARGTTPAPTSGSAPASAPGSSCRGNCTAGITSRRAKSR